MELHEVRRRIDSIDRELLGILHRRMELALRAGKLKGEVVVDKSREAQVLSQAEALRPALLGAEFVKDLYTGIIQEARRLEHANKQLIGFQGEHGAFSELAIRTVAAEAVSIPHAEFVEVFEGVRAGALDLGMVPVENSLGGNVTQVDDLLIGTNLYVVGEVLLPVHQCLIALHETDYRDIRVVYSHPQALSQCRGFIQRNKLEPRPYYDTAGSALMLRRDRPAAAAVIASSLCAELYDLEIIKENVEDNPKNITRFLLLSRTPGEGGDKCSVVFSTAHKPGALFHVLSAFSKSELNLTRIESRPVPDKPGEYAFLLDFLGSSEEPAVKAALRTVEEQVASFRLLGCYKRAMA